MSVNSDAIWSILDNQVKFFFNRDCDADVYAEFEGPRQVICFEPIDGRLFQSFLRRSYRAETDGEICTNFDIYVQAACDDALWDETLNRVSIRHRVHGSLQKGLVYSLSVAATERPSKRVRIMAVFRGGGLNQVVHQPQGILLGCVPSSGWRRGVPASPSNWPEYPAGRRPGTGPAATPPTPRRHKETGRWPACLFGSVGSNMVTSP